MGKEERSSSNKKWGEWRQDKTENSDQLEDTLLEYFVLWYLGNQHELLKGVSLLISYVLKAGSRLAVCLQRSRVSSICVRICYVLQDLKRNFKRKITRGSCIPFHNTTLPVLPWECKLMVFWGILASGGTEGDCYGTRLKLESPLVLRSTQIRSSPEIHDNLHFATQQQTDGLVIWISFSTNTTTTMVAMK
jgi:hypothetical protein